VPAPACCLDIEMAGEQSWNEFNASVRKTVRIAQPPEIVTEQEAIHWNYSILKSVVQKPVTFFLTSAFSLRGISHLFFQ